jgi:N6-L-threonylcarbamoyladenine synthase
MVLAIESSCDETAAAVVHDGVVLANTVASQALLHSEYGGVVPELAVREHLRNLLPVVRDAMGRAGVTPSDLTAVAATRGPGLPAALAAGYAAAQGFALARGLPLFGVHHHEAHLYSPWISGTPPHAAWDALEPHVCLVVSGGHTLLVRVDSFGRHAVLGGTLDDAAGECLDKCAKLMGLGYPGGPQVDQLAEQGRADASLFPRPTLHEAHDDFSFSGLKTSVRTYLARHPGCTDDGERLRNLCAELRAAVVDVLVGKALRAARRQGVRCITASGGVACSVGFRRELALRCQREGLACRIALPAYCTDNAAMVAVLGEQLVRSGAQPDAPGLEVSPGWELATVRHSQALGGQPA